MITPSFGLTATERVLPKLALDFTTASLDARVTFTRTTGASNPATYTNSSGVVTAATNNEPRFDYDPVALTCKGLLIEESRTNKCLYSEDFRNTADAGATRPWAYINTTLDYHPAGVTAPNGLAEACKIVENTATGNHYIYQNCASTSANFSYSIFAKDAGRQYLRIMIATSGFSSGSRVYATFDLQTGTSTINGITTSNIAASTQAFPNGWYRCTVTATITAGTTPAVGLFLSNVSGSSSTLPSYTGDGTSGVYVWGGDLEEALFATSYIPTTATTLTRNADVATMTGTNFSDWWQSTRGGVLVRARPSTVSGVRPWLQFDDGTANEIIALRGNTTNPELYIVDGGTPQAQIDAGTIAANTDYSLTGWWATNDCKARLDSGAVVTDTSATIPTVTQARLGSDGTNYLNGHLASISYYDTFSGQIYTRRKNKVIFNLM